MKKENRKTHDKVINITEPSPNAYFEIEGFGNQTINNKIERTLFLRMKTDETDYSKIKGLQEYLSEIKPQMEKQKIKCFVVKPKEEKLISKPNKPNTEKGEIIQGRIWFHKPKLFFKRLFGMKFRYKCIVCGKGHDGFIIHSNAGFGNMADFCSSKCADCYINKYGYSFRQRITDEKDICIVCGKEHNNRFINFKENKITRNFCSKNCLNQAKEKLLPKIKEKYKKGLSNFIDLFKEGKTTKNLKKNSPVKYFESINLDLKEILK